MCRRSGYWPSIPQYPPTTHQHQPVGLLESNWLDLLFSTPPREEKKTTACLHVSTTSIVVCLTSLRLSFPRLTSSPWPSFTVITHSIPRSRILAAALSEAPHRTKPLDGASLRSLLSTTLDSRPSTPRLFRVDLTPSAFTRPLVARRGRVSPKYVAVIDHRDRGRSTAPQSQSHHYQSI